MRWPRRLLAVALVLALALAAAATWVKVERTMRHPRPVVITKHPRVSALVWSGRVYVDPETFRRWLAGRDVAYADWARLHPRALAILQRARALRR